MQDYDINGIGAGSKGSSMTFKLAQTGRETLLFEIGFVRNEKGNGDGKRVVAEGIMMRLIRLGVVSILRTIIGYFLGKELN